MLELLNITPFGALHTLIAIIGVLAGFIALFRHRQIRLDSTAGRLFFWFTLGAAVTGLFIFRRGGFGPPHVLSVLTLLVLGLAWFAEKRSGFGRLSGYAAVLLNLTALFFHFIPASVETLTRLPLGAPYAAGPEDPRLFGPIGAAFAAYLIGAVWQLLRVRGAARRASSAGADLA
ncbi:hypothetical protein QLQ15_15145 [Lysobacter sp. LF1]|uniref:DUF2306 domain-containing protein n=1 Tax=Lysobacter stagni TaxID=3045172 RepID=A0ABT6XKG7_9GAMM|nr:hypothetical protein [Lysobacter sp. LF1]MDI9240245.1 hypothetical protein [Lysobacter sp. LF1]